MNCILLAAIKGHGSAKSEQSPRFVITFNHHGINFVLLYSGSCDRKATFMANTIWQRNNHYMYNEWRRNVCWLV